MSVSWVERKLEVTNCARAKLMPQTRVAGSVALTPRPRSMMKTSAMRHEQAPGSASGGPRPATRSCSGSPVTVASVVIGTARAPNATGAVLATSATTAAFIGRKPSAMSMTLVIATGVPKPASASSSAPKQNAMMIGLDALVVTDPGEGAPQDVEVPGHHRHVVEPDRVDDDPQDGEEPEGSTLGSRHDGLARPASSRRRSRRAPRRAATPGQPSTR